MPSSASRTTFQVTGLDCAEEVGILKREIGPLVGGEENLSFDVLSGRMTVRNASQPVSAIITAINRTGMKAQLASEATGDAERANWWQRHGRVALTIASGILTATALSLHVWQTGSWQAALGSEGVGMATPVPTVARLLYVFAIASGVFFVLPKALFAIRSMRPDMNLLMVIAVLGAVAIGEWFEGSTVSFLFAFSLTLESWSVGRARRAIEKLLDLAPATVRVVGASGQVNEVAASAVPIGTDFQIRPGERIGLDGEVVSGFSDVNQAPITGESVPVSKEPGSPVFAGTLNGTAALMVRSTKAAGDTTLANIIRLVDEAKEKRAPSEQWVDRFARYYTPAVMALSLLVLLVPTLAFGQPFEPWIYQALVLLVIACPCALVISTPVSVVAALASSAKYGVLVKGGLHLETAASLKAVAFDKTGTLTRGKPEVVEVVSLNGHDEVELMERAMALETHSDHPLALAILEYGRFKGIQAVSAEEFSIIPGKGASGTWSGKRYWLGSHRFLEERRQETPEVHDALEKLSATGKTVVVIGNDEHVCGFIALADEIRPESAAVVSALNQTGVQHVIMLTGDNRGTAQEVAKRIGLSDFEAELLPQDKVAAIGKLVDRFGLVAMIGDGINDAPALRAASLGISMAAAGSDTAMEAADIALMSDDLTKVPWLIRHAKRMMGIIRANIVLSLAVKAVFVALTLAGTASLWTAIAADMGISLLVIANALRLLATDDKG